MPKWRLLEKALIAENGNHGVVYEAGTEIGDGTQVPFSGEPGPHMEPLDEGARILSDAAEAKAAKENREWISPNAVMNKLSLAIPKPDNDVKPLLEKMTEVLATLAGKRGPGRPPAEAA